MRLAVFTNQFPALVSTFFARDMRGLIEAGIDIDVFPIYPLKPELWNYVPTILNERYLPRQKVHHLSVARGLRDARPWPFSQFASFLRDATIIGYSAAKFGIQPLAKTTYALLEAWIWAHEHHSNHDHILAYWGNYSATSAYMYHRLTAPYIPFSVFLHAGLDLYLNPLDLQQKLLYADNIITCSDFNISYMQNRFPVFFDLIREKIYVHQHGLDFEDFSYEPDRQSANRVIAVGRLEHQKGFDYLLRATNELKNRGIDIEIEFIGDGQQAHALQALVNMLGIVDRVKFRGWLSFDEVQKAMRQATILVHPSPDLGDGIPNVIKEAMAIGTPVVASDVAGIPEVLEHGRCGILVPPKDVPRLAEAIESLLANETKRRQLADAARHTAEKKFDLWRNGAALADLLRSTTRRNPAHSTG